MKRSTLSRPLLLLTVGLFLLAVIAGGVLYLSPVGAPLITENSGGFGPFDLRLSYTPDALITVLSHYTGERTAEYERYYLLDFLFIGLYTLPQITGPLLFYRMSRKHYLLFRASVFSGIMHTFFDVIENILLLNITHSTPFFTGTEGFMSSVCTSMKWAFAGIFVGSFMLFILTTLFTLSRRKAKTR